MAARSTLGLLAICSSVLAGSCSDAELGKPESIATSQQAVTVGEWTMLADPNANLAESTVSGWIDAVPGRAGVL